jgi:type IV secretion system protein VirB2
MKNIVTRISTGLATIAMSGTPMFAATGGGAGGGALPWEGPLTTISTSLTGPVAFAIAVIAMAATGGMLVFGGELNEFMRKACMLVLAIAVLVGGASLMRTLFPNVSGALIF